MKGHTLLTSHYKEITPYKNVQIIKLEMLAFQLLVLIQDKDFLVQDKTHATSAIHPIEKLFMTVNHVIIIIYKHLLLLKISNRKRHMT